MTSNEILDDDFNEQEVFTKKRTQELTYITIALMIVNSIAFYFMPIPDQGIVSLDGTIATPDQVRIAGVQTFLIVIPIISFLLASLFNFIPYKKLNYKKKYFRFAIVTLLILNVIFLFGIALKFFNS